MKSALIISMIALSALAFASDKPTPKCADQAVYEAVAKNYKTFEVSTDSCGIKALNISRFLETYVVCTTDETDPMEYIVTVIPEKTDKKTGAVLKTCVVDYAKSSSESETPSFDSDEGLIKDAKQCSVQYGDAQIICK